MRVLVTGASGLIGKYCLAQLAARGHDTHAVSTIARPYSAAVQWHQANLLVPDQTIDLIRNVKPTHLLHRAWTTEHGKFWASPDNHDWVRASLLLAKEFAEYGGERLVVAGTCAEYQWANLQDSCLTECFPCVPATLYGECKHSLQQTLHTWGDQKGVSIAWGRIFSLYGPDEDPRRLVASTIISLLQNKLATCGQPQLKRDYAHAADVATAFVTLLEGSIEGPVNVGCGRAYTLGEIVETIASKLNAVHLLELSPFNRKTSNEPIALYPGIGRLKTTGWLPQFTLSDGLDDTIEWWRRHLNNVQN
jgi:nucleoside-diphosphate-sugar epimerase